MLKNETNKDDKKGILNYNSIFEEYILWYALPIQEKTMSGIETDVAFADYYKISRITLIRWKDRPRFESEVRYLRRKWAFGKTGHVIEGIYRSAVKGNDKSQKLWMQVFEGFTEKTEITETKKVELTIDDLRFIIDGFPSKIKEKYYGYIREIIDTAISLRDTGRLQDGVTSDQIIEGTILNETDNDAQDISSKRDDVVAKGYTEFLCENMEWSIPTNNYQSSSRWW